MWLWYRLKHRIKWKPCSCRNYERAEYWLAVTVIPVPFKDPCCRWQCGSQDTCCVLHNLLRTLGNEPHDVLPVTLQEWNPYWLWCTWVNSLCLKSNICTVSGSLHSMKAGHPRVPPASLTLPFVPWVVSMKCSQHRRVETASSKLRNGCTMINPSENEAAHSCMKQDQV